MTEPSRSSDASGRTWSVLGGLALLAQAAVAAGWAWVSPHGFPALHPQWWANLIAPALALVVVALGLALLGTGRRGAARAVLLGLAGAWAGAALGAVVVFPTSGARMALPAAFVAAALLALVRRGAPLPHGWPAGLAVAVGLGALAPATQRAPAPDTRPAGSAGARPTTRVGAAPGWADVGAARLWHDVPGARVAVEPLLTFTSCSPDGGWTLFAPGAVRREYTLTALEAGATVRAAYAREDAFDRTTAVIEAQRDGRALLVDATTTLEQPVFSHLNAFTRVVVQAREPAPLSIVCSPCPGTAVEVGFADYPVGRPMRLAYLDADGVFHVVEARSGEKGPFRELARGPLRAGEALTITVLAGGAPVVRVTWADWSAQVGTALSPTAGWGLPVNAVELSLAATGVLDLRCTLAATGVGRGYQSVGHAAGAYRNRLRVEAP